MSELRFLQINDPHLTNRWPLSRVDNYEETMLLKLAWAVNLANSHRAHIVFGGDYVDKYNTTPEVINALIKILAEAELPIFGVVGNHDVYGQNYAVLDKVIIGTLFSSGTINLLDKNPLFIHDSNAGEGLGLIVQLTGANYVPDIDRDPGAYAIVKDPVADVAIHVVHGYLVKRLLPNVNHANYKVITEVVTGADIILSGHEHIGYGIETFSNCTFCNPGALSRINADLREIARTPRVALITINKTNESITHNIELIDVPCKPGSEVLSRERIEDNIKRQAILENFSKSLEGGPILCNIDNMLKDYAKTNNIPEKVQEMSRKAIDTYDKMNV